MDNKAQKKVQITEGKSVSKKEKDAQLDHQKNRGAHTPLRKEKGRNNRLGSG